MRNCGDFIEEMAPELVPLSPVQGSRCWKVKGWGVELRLEIKYTIDVYVNKENVKLTY